MTLLFACFKNNVIHILRYGFLQILKALRDCHRVLLHLNQTCTCADCGGTLKRFVSFNTISSWILRFSYMCDSFNFISLFLQDLKNKPRYLVTFTVGYNQRHNIDACIKKVASCPLQFSVLVLNSKLIMLCSPKNSFQIVSPLFCFIMTGE